MPSIIDRPNPTRTPGVVLNARRRRTERLGFRLDIHKTAATLFLNFIENLGYSGEKAGLIAAGAPESLLTAVASLVGHWTGRTWVMPTLSTAIKVLYS